MPAITGEGRTLARRRRKLLEGTVVSDKMDKTVVVQVRTLVRDPVYKRVVKRSRRFRAHDADRQAHLGDLVRIMETRPLSATKRWRLVAVLERAR